MSAEIVTFPRAARRRPRRARLRFVVDRKRAGLPPGHWPRCFWHVSPTGDYRADIEAGARLAVRYLESGAAVPLQWIVADMPRELTGIEIGFLNTIGRAAQAALAEPAVPPLGAP